MVSSAVFNNCAPVRSDSLQESIRIDLAKYAEGDVKGQLSFYDHNNNGLIEYDWGALTGNDADAVSFDWKSGNMDRAESAYVYSGALASANTASTLRERSVLRKLPP